MNILHVLSQFEVTGAEAYAVSLIEEQVQSGHSAIVVSDTLTLPVKAQYISHPIGKRSYAQRLRNVLTLVRLIRANRIDLVHAHSRAASWISFFACRWTRTPFVSTIHGRQHVHTSSRAMSVYGKDIIAVSPTLKVHLEEDLGISPANIVCIPNGIDLHHAALPDSETDKEPHRVESEPHVIFVGRLTGPKGDVVRVLLAKVLPRILQIRSIRFQAIGAMITPEDIPRLAASLNAEFKKPVAELLGFQKDIAAHMIRADLIIGSGRIVLESLLLRKPVIAFGESDYVGLVTPQTYEAAASTNFGDTGYCGSFPPERVVADVLNTLEHPPSAAELTALADLTSRRYGSRTVAIKVQRLYQRAYARANSAASIPVLMYHRVLDRAPEKSAHGIWVTAAQFRQQLRSLRARGFETITFRDYSRFLEGKAGLPRRPIVLTFDDGYEDNYTTAFPLLQEYGCRAIIFAVTALRKRTNAWDPAEPPAPLLTPHQLLELARAGIEIGSHTSSHPKLTAAPADEARREISDSKTELEQLLGSEVMSFAYPYGAVDESAKSMVEEAGYRFAAATNSGPLAIYQDFFEIRRTQVFPWTNQAGFWKKSLPLYHLYKKIKS